MSDPSPWPIVIPGGTGALGRGLAARLAAARNPVTLGSRDVARAEAFTAVLTAINKRCATRSGLALCHVDRAKAASVAATHSGPEQIGPFIHSNESRLSPRRKAPWTRRA